MSSRYRYETLMLTAATPVEMKNMRTVIGKMSGYFELPDLPSGGIVMAGVVKTPKESIEFFGVDGESGVYRFEGAVHSNTFEAEGPPSLVRERLDHIVREVGKYGKADIRRTFYPHQYAEAALSTRTAWARAVEEIRERDYKDIDMERCVAIHNEHADVLSRYLFCDRNLYLPHPAPFLAVHVTHGVVNVQVGTGDPMEYMKNWPGCVRMLHVTDLEEAQGLAASIARSGEVSLNAEVPEIDLFRPEMFAFDIDAVQFRMTGERMMASFAQSLRAVSAEQVALGMNMREMDLARELRMSLDLLDSRRGLDRLEAAITACADYEDENAVGRFVSPKDISSRILVELWQDRVVDVAGLSLSPSRTV